MRRVLICRTDKIGDVLLSTPVASALKEAMPGCRISFLVRPQTRRVLEGHPAVDETIPLDGFFRCLREIQRRRFDAALILWPDWRATLLAFLAGIPRRIGPFSKAWALLFTEPLEQGRWWARKHEAEYNLELAERIAGRPLRAATPRFCLRPEDEEAAERFLRRKGMTEPFVVLHPGGKGSARRWPLENFARLARELRRPGLDILFTGDETEAPMLRKAAEEAGCPDRWLDQPVDLGGLAAILARARLFVSNSTGPLHIAAALGVPVVGFYCPILPTSPRRWGPLTERRRILRPQVPQCRACVGEACPYFDCMDLIPPETARRACEELLREAVPAA